MFPPHHPGKKKHVIECFISGRIVYDESMGYYLDPVTKDNVFTLVCASPICKPIQLFYLKKWNVDLEHVNAKGESGLHAAIVNFGTVEIFKKIIEYLPANSVIINQRDNYGNSPIHVCCGINSNRTNEILKVLLHTPTIDVNIKTTTDGFSPLHLAVRSSNYDAIRILSKSEQKVVDPNVRDQFGKTPIFHANTLDLLEFLHECFGERINWKARDVYQQSVFDYMMLQLVTTQKSNSNSGGEFEHLFRFLLKRDAMTNPNLYNWEYTPRLKSCVMWRKLLYFIRNKPFCGRRMSPQEVACMYNEDTINLDDVTNKINLSLDPFVSIPREFWFKVQVSEDVAFLFDIREVHGLKQNPYTNKPFDTSVLAGIEERYMFLQTHRLFMKDYSEFKSESQITSTMMMTTTTTRTPESVLFFAERLSYVSVEYLQSRMSEWAIRDIHDFAQLPPLPETTSCEGVFFLNWLHQLVKDRPQLLAGVDYGFTRRRSFEECCSRLAERLSIDDDLQLQAAFEPFDVFTRRDLEYIIQRHYREFNLTGMPITQNRLLQKYATVEFLAENIHNDALMADLGRHINDL